MQLFLTHEGQIWNISPYVNAIFSNHTLRIFSSTNVAVVYATATAEVGESYYVQVFGHEKNPVLKKVAMPENRGDKILWALSFVEPEKRVSTVEEFWEKQPQVADAYGSKVSIIHFVKDEYAFYVAKRSSQPGKGHRSHQTKYKPCLAWCSDNISEESLQDLIKKYRRYRKIYCPIEFLMTLR